MLAAQMEKNNSQSINMLLNNEWDYVNLNWCNYEKNIHITNNYKNLVNLRITDNDAEIVIK